MQSEFERDRHRLVESLAGRGGLEPADLHAPTLWFTAECLRRVKSFSTIPRQLRSLRREFFPVELPDHVLAARRSQHPFRVFRIAIHRHLKQVGALEKSLDAALERPRFQIRRRLKCDPAFPLEFIVKTHHPMLRRRVPEQARIASDVLHHRIPGVFLPCPSAIVGVHDALAAPRARERRDEQIIPALFPTARVFLVHDGAARPHIVAKAVRIKRDGKFTPVDEVRADGMAPMLLAVEPAVRIELEVEMVFALREDEPVRIIQPAAPRRKVKLRAQRLAINIAGIPDDLRLLHRRERRRILRQPVHAHRRFFSRPRADIEMRPPLRIVRQFDLEFAHHRAIHEHRDAMSFRARLHGKMEKVFFDRDVARGVLHDHGHLAIGENNLVHIDVAPPPFRIVHDLNARRFPRKLAHVPSLRVESFGAAACCVGAGSRADDHSIDEQIHARLAIISAATDQE